MSFIVLSATANVECDSKYCIVHVYFFLCKINLSSLKDVPCKSV